MANEELTSGTIADLAARLRQGEVSPVEVTAAHLARIERLNGTLKAYLTVLPERAMAAARRAEAEIRDGQYRGPLHGVPVAVKDLYAIKGERMTCGSTILAQHVAEQHATVNQRLEDAGAILLLWIVLYLVQQGSETLLTLLNLRHGARHDKCRQKDQKYPSHSFNLADHFQIHGPQAVSPR